MIIANTNTFGVEIETVIPVAALTNAGWLVGSYHVGAEIPNSDGWKAMRDGSIQAAEWGSTGVEIVSPVLSGAAGITKVDAMVARLQTMGAKVNASCGLHVHIGFNGSAQQLAKLISLVSFHEKALYASTGTKNREVNHYCGSIKLAYKPLEKMTAMSTMNRICGDRYRALNLQNLIDGRRPTVEFRVFAGTLNATKIKAYIQICLALVQKAMSNASKKSAWDRDVNSSKPEGTASLIAFLAAMGWQKFHGDALENRSTFGMLTPDAMPEMVAMLKKMAKKYDATA